MRPLFPCLVLIAVTSVLLAEPAFLPVKPRPRPRIDRSATTTQVQLLEAPVPATEAVVMDKVTVMGKRVVEVPRTTEKEYRGTFSPYQGGVLKRENGKTVSYELGLWRPVAVLQADEAFKTEVVRAEANFFRLSW
jgi:hypothetical protein